MSTLSQPLHLSREQIADAMAHIGSVASALQRLPYRDAVEPLMAVNELQEAVMALLPGGYEGECINCELAVGRSEIAFRYVETGSICCTACADAGNDLPTIHPAKERARA